MTRHVRLIALAALAAGLSGVLHAQNDHNAQNIAGKWNLTVKSPHGEVAMVLVLEQDGRKVTGTFSSSHTGDLPIEGEFNAGALKLATTKGNADSRITLDSRLKDDGTLAGYLSTASADMTWTAQRAKDK
jgi:hypothetical protein